MRDNFQLQADVVGMGGHAPNMRGLDACEVDMKNLGAAAKESFEEMGINIFDVSLESDVGIEADQNAGLTYH